MSLGLLCVLRAYHMCPSFHTARPGSWLFINRRVTPQSKLRGYPQFEIGMSSRRFKKKQTQQELKKHTRKFSMPDFVEEFWCLWPVILSQISCSLFSLVLIVGNFVYFRTKSILCTGFITSLKIPPPQNVREYV